MLKLAYKHRNHAKWIPVILFFVVCTIFWVSGSVRYGGDSPRYTEGAERLLAGASVDNDVVHFLGYVFFVAGIYSLNLGDTGVIMAQTIIVGISMMALFDLGKRFGNETVGIVAASLHAVNLEIHQWSFYVLTETLYISFVIFTSWSIYRAIEADKPTAWIFLSAVSSVFMATIRPQGWIMLPVMLIFFLAGLLRKQGAVYSISAFVLYCLFISTALWLPHTLKITSERPNRLISQGYYASDVYNSLLKGEIVWHNDEMKIFMPPDQGSVGEGLVGVVNYCSRNIAACANLFVRRIIVELAYLRPYYSFNHNLAIILTFPLLYILSFFGIYMTRREFITRLALSLIGVHLLFVGVTYSDHNGRFLLYILPIITLFSAIGAVSITHWIGGYYRRIISTASR